MINKHEDMVKALDDIETQVKDIATRLKEICDIEKNHKYIMLPCNIGDRVYYPFDSNVLSTKITDIEISESGTVFSHDNSIGFRLENFGKTWFSTFDEAKEHL